MTTDRRDFLQQLTVGAMTLGALPIGLDATTSVVGSARSALGATDWDMTWTKRVTGKYRTVFDVPEVDSGYGVWRASIWPKQYGEVLGIPQRDMTSVLVLRHNGIALAMQQSFWDKYGIGKTKSALHPVTQQPTDRNPALLSSTVDGTPAAFDDFALPKFLARGGIALACDLALQDCIGLIKARENVSDDEARKQAIAYLVPGVILQPSGVFAAIRAQDVGCKYLRAS
jgi:hypothetical protein